MCCYKCQEVCKNNPFDRNPFKPISPSEDPPQGWCGVASVMIPYHVPELLRDDTLPCSWAPAWWCPTMFLNPERLRPCCHLFISNCHSNCQRMVPLEPKTNQSTRSQPASQPQDRPDHEEPTCLSTPRQTRPLGANLPLSNQTPRSQLASLDITTRIAYYTAGVTILNFDVPQIMNWYEYLFSSTNKVINEI